MDRAVGVLVDLARRGAAVAPDGTTSSWTALAELISSQSEDLVRAWKTLLEEETSPTLSLSETREALLQRLETEDHPPAQVGVAISLLVVLVYECVAHPDNYLFTLQGEEEMAILRRPIVYYVHMCQRPEQNVLWQAFFLTYVLQSVSLDRLIVGIDFEFTRGQVEMMQVAFEHPTDLRSITYLVSPAELSAPMMEQWIVTVMTEMRITKILHGSDALDMPYVYHQMLGDQREWALRLAGSQLDTRLLCEYYKLNETDLTQIYCSIYDNTEDRSAVYFFGVVDQAGQTRLAEILDSMPNQHDRQWNIHNMPESMVRYAQYDVLFLKYFYYRMVRMGSERGQTKEERRDLMNIYRRVIPQLSGLVTLETNGFVTLRAKCKEESDHANNYMIRTGKGKMLKLIDIWKRISTGIVTADPEVHLDRVSKVTQFRKTIEIITKRLTYGHLSQQYRVYRKKEMVWEERLTNDAILQFFPLAHLDYLGAVWVKVDEILRTRVAGLDGR